MPGPAPFLIFPFETAWMHARAGTLHVGDPAPEFSLLRVDKSERVQLSPSDNRCKCRKIPRSKSFRSGRQKHR
jgi:hypothetical protein